MNISKKKIYILIGILIAFVILNSREKTYKLTTLTKDSVVLAFGDSLTHGTGASDEDSYPAQLSKLLSLPVVNAGIPGEISSVGLRRLPDVLAKTQPDLVILCHGGNDILRGLSLKKLKSNLTKMIQLIRAAGSDVLLVAVPQKGLILSSLPLYKELSTELELPCENKVIASTLSSRSLKSDYVHPNAKGYKQIASAIYDLIHESMSEK